MRLMMNSHSMTYLFRVFLIAMLSASLMLVAGCSTPRTKPASVTDRSGGNSNEPAPPGYYRVKRGDTLARIALDHGQAPRDVAQWNKAENSNFNPNVIEVGDLILIKPPASAKMAAAKPVEKKSPADKADAPAPAETTKPEPAKSEMVAEPGIRLSWPAKGKVTGEFNETNKGIDIAGKVGEPVLAAADGKVVTEILPLDNYWPAEDYHQDYFANNPENQYCVYVVSEKVEKFKKTFAELLKLK